MGKVSESGPLSAVGLRIAVVAARYNAELVEQLISGASEALARRRRQPEALRVERVPGAFELPLAAQALAAEWQLRCAWWRSAA